MSQLKTFVLIILIFFVTLGFFYFDSSKILAQTTHDATKVQLLVENCNHNLICEPQFGENFQGCASDCLPPPATTTQPTPRKTGSEIISPIIIPSSTSTLITWTTNNSARAVIAWGISSDYESGTVAEINYGTYHEILLTNLTPGTRYFLKIESTDEYGTKIFRYDQFFTLPSPDLISPSNVNNIHIELKNDTSGYYLHITWNNPNDFDFESVRIIRSTDFYSFDPKDSVKVFQGNGQSFDDYNLNTDVDYYYSFFSQDSDGNFSSGALAHVRLSLISDQIVKNPNTEILGNITNASSTNSQTNFDLSNFEILQINSTQGDWSHLEINNEEILGVVGKPIVVRLSKDKLSQDTKYILFSVENETQNSKFNSYWLRSINDQNNLEVDIPAFEKEGQYNFFVTFLNDDREVISQAHGVFQIKKEIDPTSSSMLNWLYMWISQIIKWIKAFFVAHF